MVSGRVPERLTWSWLVDLLPPDKRRPMLDEGQGYQHEVDLGFLLNPANGCTEQGHLVTCEPSTWAVYLAARDLYEVAYLDGAQRAKALQGPALAVLRAAGALLGDPWAQGGVVEATGPSLAGQQGPEGSTLGQLADDVEKLARQLEAGAKALRAYGRLTEAQRDRLRQVLPSLAAEGVAAAARAHQPLPLTDVCICRTCKRVLLPDEPWGSPWYHCCGRRWTVDPRAGYGPLPNDFWSRFKPGDRCTLELAPNLDARGNPIVAPNC